MKLQVLNRLQIESQDLPADSAIISFSDSPEQAARLPDGLPALRIVCDDVDRDVGQVVAPTLEQAAKILSFVNLHAEKTNLFIQCEKGIGRSLATAAAIGRLNGANPRPLLERCTHNRKLYALLNQAGGKPLDPDPLVSIVIRCKYGWEALSAFVHCMRKQRYENWELIAVTDGPDPASYVVRPREHRLFILETPVKKGRWGHPYRQLGIDNSKGQFFGLSNDDNYYVPTYLERMVLALDDQTDLAYCDTVHSYAGGGLVQVTAPKPGLIDLGGFIARRSLTESVKWEGDDWLADGRYIQRLALASRRTVHVPYPLFIHN